MTIRRACATPVSLLAATVLLAATAALSAAQSVSLVVPPAGAARDAFQALEEGRYKDADAAFARALAARPDDPALLLGAGLTARRLSDTARARDLLTRALQVDPALTPASQLLGTMLYEAGDIEGAIRVYDAALVRAPEQARMQARVEEWRKEAALHEGFRKTLGGHFAVLFEGPAEEDAAVAAVDILEGAYDSIGSLLQTFPAEPITVVLYTQQQFRDVTRTPGWSGGLFDGRIRLPVRGGLADRREFERVLTHEYVHAVVHSVAAGGVPAWLNEGLAAALEIGRRGSRAQGHRARDDRAAEPAWPVVRIAAGLGRNRGLRRQCTGGARDPRARRPIPPDGIAGGPRRRRRLRPRLHVLGADALRRLRAGVGREGPSHALGALSGQGQG